MLLRTPGPGESGTSVFSWRGGAARAAFYFAAPLLALALAACVEDGPSGSGGDTDDDGDGGAATSSSAGGAGQGGGGAAPATQPLTIVNWNTHNFFNDKNDDPSPDEYVVSTSDYTAKRKDVADVLVKLDADIAVLQEIENESVLKDLNGTISVTAGAAYPEARLVPSFDQREIAVLSRVPIEEVVSHQDEYFEQWGTNGPSYRYTRDCLEVHLTYNGRKIVLLGVHFRSKVAPDMPEKRLAEAQHTRDIANALATKLPDAAIVVLGDYNDTPGSPPYLALIGEGDAAYTNAAMLVAEPARWSYEYNGTPELIDHQLSNPLLAKMLDTASVRLEHTPEVDKASDHAPLIATYNVY
jgi:endonuclease/exonuclease/phosphatase family metal-dependent hydrolase